MDDTMHEDSGPGEHRFNARSASPALKQAMAELARESGRAETDFAGMTLQDAYDLAVETYPEQLPEFWRVWQSWNVAHEDPPAPMGDL